MRKKIASFISIPAILFSVSFVLTAFAHNIIELYLRVLPLSLVLAVLFALVISMFSSIFLKNNAKRDIFSTWCVIIFFTYGGLLSFIRNIFSQFSNVTVDRNYIALFLSLSLIFAAYKIIKRMPKIFSPLAKFLKIFGIAITIFPIVSIMQFQITQKSHSNANSILALPNASELAVNKLPDIYYIMPEDYAGSWVLKQYFNMDNNTFVDYLQDKGFYVADKSTSNYPKTFLSLASSLNMEYLSYLSDRKNSSDQTVVNPLIENNNALRFLKNVGYSYYQMGSWWGPTKYNDFADNNFVLENKNLPNIDEFTYYIIKSTTLNFIFTKFFPTVVVGDSNKDYRNRILYQFSILPTVVNLSGPKFVFVHIIAPHGPYVFDQNCKSIALRQTKNIPEEQNYTNQTTCINKKLESAINVILKDSAKPPVIILQSDEGAPFLNNWLNPGDNWKTADNKMLVEKFPILNAYYLPGVSQEKLYPSITPVNSFRLVFDLYFNAKFPLLPDKNYIFSDLNHAYEFKDVTNVVSNK